MSTGVDLTEATSGHLIWVRDKIQGDYVAEGRRLSPFVPIIQEAAQAAGHDSAKVRFIPGQAGPSEIRLSADLAEDPAFVQQLAVRNHQLTREKIEKDAGVEMPEWDRLGDQAASATAKGRG